MLLRVLILEGSLSVSDSLLRLWLDLMAEDWACRMMAGNLVYYKMAEHILSSLMAVYDF